MAKGDTEVKTVWEPQPGPQTLLLQCPVFEILFGGARGGGKSDAVLGEFACHAYEYGAQAIGLCIRRERIQLTELIERSKVIYSALGAKFSEIDKMWRFPNGARLRFAYLESDSDAQNYLGHSYTRVYVEEMSTFPNPEPIFKLMATLSRNPKVKSKFIAPSNPGGPGHLWIKQRYIDPDPAGFRVITTEYTDPFTKKIITKDRVFIPSLITQNMYTNTSEYIANLYMSGDAQIVKAWLLGDWNVILGSFFPEFETNRHVIKTFVPPKHWTRFMSLDWGSSTPFCVGWYCVVPDDYDITKDVKNVAWVNSDEQARNPILPAGAIIKYREYYGSLWRQQIDKGLPSAAKTNPNTGLKLTAKEVAENISMLEANEPRDAQNRARIAWRVADPKVFSSDNGPSVAETMSKSANIFLSRADNARVQSSGAMSGWDALRSRLKGDGLTPMLFWLYFVHP